MVWEPQQLPYNTIITSTLFGFKAFVKKIGKNEQNRKDKNLEQYGDIAGQRKRGPLCTFLSVNLITIYLIHNVKTKFVFPRSRSLSGRKRTVKSRRTLISSPTLRPLYYRHILDCNYERTPEEHKRSFERWEVCVIICCCHSLSLEEMDQSGVAKRVLCIDCRLCEKWKHRLRLKCENNKELSQ